MKNPTEKTDLRVRRTRKLLWEALLSLLESRPFESLSVQEICDKAMVHRTTFYKHFEDKYHLLSYGLEETKGFFKDKTHEERILHPMQMIEALGHLRHFQKLMNAEQERPSLGCILQQNAENSLIQDLLQEEKKGSKFPVPVEIIAAFYSGALASLFGWWLRNESRATAEEMDRYLSLLIHKPTFFPRSSPESDPNL